MNELFDEIMAKKEKEEKIKEEQQRVDADPNDPSTWTSEMIADYFIWIMKKKGQSFVESTMDAIIEKLKEIGY